MKIGITIFEGRVSPVFDTCQSVLCIETVKQKEVSREKCAIHPGNPLARVNVIKEKRIDILICGAISERFLYLLTESHIKVHPFVAGNTEEIIKSYLAGKNINDEFSMPGCCGRWRGCGKGQKQKGRRC